VLPKWRGYRIRQEVLALDNGATTHKLVNVKLAQLEQWDRTHDVTGKITSAGGASGSDSRSSRELGVLRERISGEKNV